MNLLNRYGVSERFLTQASMFPEYKLARVVDTKKSLCQKGSWCIGTSTANC